MVMMVMVMMVWVMAEVICAAVVMRRSDIITRGNDRDAKPLTCMDEGLGDVYLDRL